MNVSPLQTGPRLLMNSSSPKPNLFLRCALLAAALLMAGALQAIEPGDVRDFGDVFVISAQAPDRNRVEVSWDIAPGYYLYKNRFLQFSAQTPGVVIGEPEIPQGTVSFDELLGEEVEKYHGHLTVTLPIRSVQPGISGFRLQVRSQGCLENVLCYPPTDQVLLVGLPPVAAVEPDSTEAVDQLLNLPSPAEQLGQDAAIDAPLIKAGNDPLAGLGRVDAQDPALAADSAFVYEAIGLSAETVLVRFTAQPGYYLYRDKFAFRVADASGFSVREASLPDGVIKNDPEFGDVPVIYGQVEIPVRMNRPAGPASTISLQADFQGCRDGEICYPPQSRVLSLEMPAAASAIGEPSAAGSATAGTRVACCPGQ